MVIINYILKDKYMLYKEEHPSEIQHGHQQVICVKDNIKKASYIKCYNNINNIELYRFNYKPVLNNTRDINQLGFIAQEVEEIFPKSVKRNKMIFDNKEQEILALDVTQINYTLFGAVKYLAEKVEALKKRVNKIN